jgi:hypothetical protein
MALVIRQKVPYAELKDWDAHKETITRLYWDERRTLKEVMDTMERDHNFYATYAPFFPLPFVCQEHVDIDRYAQAQDVQGSLQVLGPHQEPEEPRGPAVEDSGA